MFTQRWSRQAARSENGSACSFGSVAFSGAPTRLAANCGEADPEHFQFFLQNILEVDQAVFGSVAYHCEHKRTVYPAGLQFANTAKPASIIARTAMQTKENYSKSLLNLTHAKKRQHRQNYNDSADKVNNAVHDAASIDDCFLT